MRQMIIKSIVLALIVSVVCAQPALAYIDPNTGGVLFQVLAILFASSSAILLVFSRQIRMALARGKRFLHSLFNRKSLRLRAEQANHQRRDAH